jgi:hypothetical protein
MDAGVAWLMELIVESVASGRRPNLRPEQHLAFPSRAFSSVPGQRVFYVRRPKVTSRGKQWLVWEVPVKRRHRTAPSLVSPLSSVGTIQEINIDNYRSARSRRHCVRSFAADVKRPRALDFIIQQKDTRTCP